MVHLAGNAVLIGSQLIQRCLVCGYAIINDDLAMMASPDGSGGPSTFKTGSFVEVTGINPVEMIKVGDADETGFLEPWDGCCLPK